jgi:hypothetical protein
MTDSASPRPADTPIDNFSQCHAGILAHLSEFARLPGLLDPAAQARRIASDMLGFFRGSVYEHHAEEEAELFPAVIGAATPGDERDRVKVIAERLTREHREIEAAWHKLEPGLKDVAKGHDTKLDGAAVADLVARYQGHARYEEVEFLPLSQTILGRNDDQMAALGISLHLRHAVPELLARYGSRI